MDQDLLAFIHRVERAETIETLFDCVKDIRRIFGVNHAIYHSIQWHGETFALATYSAEWHEYYGGEQLYLIDPVVINAFKRFHPYNWKSLDWDTRKGRKLLQDAITMGVGNQGLSFPIRGPNGELALFSVSHNADDETWQKFIEDHRADLMLIGYFFHKAARRLVISRDLGDPVALSPREMETLTLLALGLNRATIAQNLQISEHTLRGYIESSRIKLSANNTTHAVSSAMARGLISL
ncbi:hypothetical protein GCM10008927_28400 [Amylibacter ulvae]|uniref:HTH luxR-type domain-containing protein n=1 Tax=Paramylibacter ulvae TaxID=1651968 RepID=A0ABQ3DCP4_9RHOB|nr:autoinducer binding domain-containing protein [Amylibacter ulvae]GHA61275.1 hypothetical protein GCM10008927_28400 [Amylibacter ulvae]